MQRKARESIKTHEKEETRTNIRIKKECFTTVPKYFIMQLIPYVCVIVEYT